MPVDKQAKNLDYLTPPRVLDPVKRYFGGQIPLDSATLASNPTKAANWCTAEVDGACGLAAMWQNHAGTFVNPPYGKEIREWLCKIGRQAILNTEILALLPVVRTEQEYFQALMHKADAVCWIRKRVSFIRPSTGEKAKGNPHASALWGFNVNLKKFIACFNDLGLVQVFDARLR